MSNKYKHPKKLEELSLDSDSDKSKKSQKSQKSQKSNDSKKEFEIKTQKFDKNTNIKNDKNKLYTLVNKTAKIEYKTYNPSDKFINENTKNFVYIKPEEYEQIYQGDYVRFLDTKNVFNRGGYCWYWKEDRDGDKYFMIGFQKVIDFSKPKVIIYFKDIKRLWKRYDIIDSKLIQSIDHKQLLINKINNFLEEKFGSEYVNYDNFSDKITKKINKKLEL